MYMSGIAQGAPVAADSRAMMLYDANKKSAVLAYVLWFFFGGLGAHRFYLGRSRSGAAMLAVTLLSLLLSVVVIGVFGLFAVGIWAIVDAFLIPGMVQEHNNKLIHQLGQ
jgi:TM2 domain-containing membrane protein YozV